MKRIISSDVQDEKYIKETYIKYMGEDDDTK